MNTIPDLSKISDYPAIKKLASALHQLDGSQHGAAIMIGAGFSRSAAHHVDGEKKMLLWNDFSKKLVAELNPNDKDLSFSDPLRVAEEYRAYFGQAALNERIRFEIDDEVWSPGPLYRSLLELPWSEIMTTNWDTLLERASKEIHGPYYTTVTKLSDLTWAASPRIVKLHGTIGTTDTFIAAQEDYRNYPKNFAPFVNFARQVFIENELCLLGFSGDDPNFLHWAGWVRDHLAGHARKIYLVGAMKLTAASRKYLESINIAPIDLWDAVKHIGDRDLKHQKAIELFLQAMLDVGKSKIKPHDWMPRNLHRAQVSHDEFHRQYKEPEYAATLLKDQLEILQEDRETYPGWLVCPPSLQWQLQNQLSSPYPNPKNIAVLSSEYRAQLLYEIAWRHSITFEYIPPWLAEEMFNVANSDEPGVLSKRQQIEVALVLLKNSRWLETKDEAGPQVIQDHTNSLLSILEKHLQYLPDCAAELAYHKAIVARDELNYAGMEALVEKITGEDPVWKLRRAALLMDLGRFDEGEKLIAISYGELRESYRRARYSIPILSRLMWAHWLLSVAHTANFKQASEKLPDFAENNYRNWKCDPWDWIENIKDNARERQDKYLKNQNPIEPLFDQGRYRDNSSNTHSSGNDTSVFFLLDGLTRSVGIPLFSGGGVMRVGLLAGTAEKLVLSGGIGVELLDYTLAVRAAGSEDSLSIKGFFTRIGVARISEDVVYTLVCRIQSAISYWGNQRVIGSLEQKGHALSTLRVLMEVLSRLVVRVPSEKAKEIFQKTLSLGSTNNLQHIWLFDVFDHLLKHSLDSIPESEQGELLKSALAFPLQSEVMSTEFPCWPNPVINHPNGRETYSDLEIRIDNLIGFVTPIGSVSSAAALLRLLPLIEKKGFFTITEHNKLTNAIWGDTPTYGKLPDTGLLPHTLLLLPAHDPELVRELVCRHLYEHDEEILKDTQKELHSFPSAEIHRAVMIYNGIANAAANRKTKLLPTAEQALTLFDRLVAWRPHTDENDHLGMADRDKKKLAESIGNALSYAIVPALAKAAKTVERFEKLKEFYENVEGGIIVMPSFVYFTPINENIVNSVEKIIRKYLQGRDAREVHYATIALQNWMRFSGDENLHQLNNLISRVIDIIESGRTVGMQQLLWIAGESFKNKLVTNNQVAVLVEAIQNIFCTTDYTHIDPNSREAISASSIREACVKLANLLVIQRPDNLALQGVLKQSKTDALPEVRFATALTGC